MTALRDQLIHTIRSDGPIRVADFMALALGHPEHGYYMTRDPFGRGGDFTTAPEISQMYGELIGLWCAVVWEQMGKPAPINLVELGPGRGTLMADALRAIGGAPAFADAFQLYLVETSPHLRTLQAAGLKDLSRSPKWVGHLGDVPAGPAIYVASEFFDALPVRQFIRSDGAWRERMVDYNATDERFIFVAGGSDEGLAALIPGQLAVADEAAVYEFSSISVGLMSALADNIANHGGAALVLDYGHEKSGLGDTLQAVKSHQFADILAEPGEADITAHVDFERLAMAATDVGAATYGVIPQSTFLRAIGIESRAESLRANAGSKQSDAIDTALRRLIGDDEMGQLFKVLAVVAADQPIPPGFE